MVLTVYLGLGSLGFRSLGLGASRLGVGGSIRHPVRLPVCLSIYLSTSIIQLQQGFMPFVYSCLQEPCIPCLSSASTHFPVSVLKGRSKLSNYCFMVGIVLKI